MKRIVDVSPGPLVIYINNKSVIDLTDNPIIHIDMRFHFIRDYGERGEVILEYVKTVRTFYISLCSKIRRDAYESGQSSLD